MKRILTAVAAAVVLAIGAPASAETLTNASVVAMVNAGLGPDTIIAKIRASATSFDLSTDQLVALKKQNVPDVVLAAMLNAGSGAVTTNAAGSNSADPTAPHASGIYLLEPDHAPPQMEHMDATVANETKTSGVLAYAFTYGLARVKIKTVLPSATARVKTSAARPVLDRKSVV